jgi:hypothetical protein
VAKRTNCWHFGSAVRFGCHLFEEQKCKNDQSGGLLSLAPEYILEEMDNDGDKSTLNLTVNLHGTTQTRCIILAKATDNAVLTLINVSWHCFRSFTIV